MLKPGVRHARRPRFPARARHGRCPPRPFVGVRQDRPRGGRADAGGIGGRAGLHGGHPQDHRRRGPAGEGYRRPDRVPRDDGWSGQNAASRGARRLAGCARRPGAQGGHGGPRDRGDRSGLCKPLSLRANCGGGRGLRDLRREHRHRRPGDDPIGGQEPRLCGGLHCSAGHGPGVGRARRGRGHQPGFAKTAGGTGLCAHGHL